MQPSSKKPRILSPWDGTKQYIQFQGGFIHDGIIFTSIEDVGVVDGVDISKVGRCIKVSSRATIPAGTELMRIPSHLLVTLSTVEQSSIGRFIFKLVDGVDKQDVQNNATKKIYNEKNDVVLALFLAIISTSKETNNSKDTDDFEGIRLYLSTLPENNSYNNLPRRWSDGTLNKYLTGTAVLERVRSEKEGLKKDYLMLQEFLESDEEMKQALSPFPTIEVFDQMLAAVGSRAFDGLGDDGLEAMVPLLDLCDHKRGVSEKSDISYHRSNDGNIIVSAKCDLKNAAKLGITYGAKGNSQLLSRYGFTIQHNSEPDGMFHLRYLFYVTPYHFKYILFSSF